MTLRYPDISQYTPVSLAGAPVAMARATISNVKDTRWDTFVQDAATHSVPLLGYCFLNHDALGVSAETQADFAYQVVGSRPVMLDHEPNRGYCATLTMATRWIDRFRAHGGVVELEYLPRWAWQGQMGSPSLQPLIDRGVALVASDYTTYSDTGPGWAPYGGMAPAVWQYTDAQPFGGGRVDFNAFRGTLQQFLDLAGGDVLSTQDIQAIVQALLGARVPNTATPDHPGDRAVVDILHDAAQTRGLGIGQVDLSVYPPTAPLAQLYHLAANPPQPVAVDPAAVAAALTPQQLAAIGQAAGGVFLAAVKGQPGA